MVDIGIGEHDRIDRRVPPAEGAGISWMKLGRGDDLLAQVGRAIDQCPVDPVRTYGNSRLRTRNHPIAAVPCEPANRAIAIPLGQTAASART